MRQRGPLFQPTAGERLDRSRCDQAIVHIADMRADPIRADPRLVPIVGIAGASLVACRC